MGKESAPSPPVASRSETILPASAVVAPESTVAQSWLDRTELTSQLLTIVCDRTGYPRDMLDLNLDLEADLGIDSIKRTEIIGYFLQGVFPAGAGGPPRTIEDLNRSRTLQEIIDQVSSCVPTPPQVEPLVQALPAAADKVEAFAAPVKEIELGRDGLIAQLLKITSDRTGYPPEMLDLNSDLEADLGVDSIKRTEIVGHFFQELFPATAGGIPPAIEDLNRSRTLLEIVDRVASHCGAAARNESKTCQEQCLPHQTAGQIEEDTGQELAVPRFTLATSLLPPVRPRSGLSPKGVVVLTEDEGEISLSLEEKLQAQGWETARIRFLYDGSGKVEGGYAVHHCSPEELSSILESIRQSKGPIVGLIHLLPLKKGRCYQDYDISGWQKRLLNEVMGLFLLGKFLEKDFQAVLPAGKPFVVAATAMGGSFASDVNLSTAEFFPGQGGIPGFLKTLQEEYPNFLIKSIDLCLDEPAGQLTNQILAEIAADDDVIEVGYKDGKRYGLELVRTNLETRKNSLNLDSSMVILITGGARGITAEVALDLAQRYQPTLILAGLSPPPPEREAEEFSGLSQPQELKTALIAAMQGQKRSVKLTEVEAAYRQLLKEREIRNNLAAMEATGAAVSYVQVDVRNPRAFSNLIEEIYETYGRLDGVIHGAGIIADKLIKDKSLETFKRVLGTKTESAFILSRSLRPETLKSLPSDRYNSSPPKQVVRVFIWKS